MKNMGETNTNPIHQEALQQEGKIKWYLSMPFILLVFFVTVCLLSIPGLVLFIIRAKKYPQKKVKTIVTAVVCYAIIIVPMIAIFNVSNKHNKEIEKLTEAGDYAGALEYIEGNFDVEDSLYRDNKAKVYELMGDYDSAAEVYLSYYEKKDPLDVYTSIINKLNSYKDKCSDAIIQRIEVLEENVAEANKKQEEEADKKTEDKKAEADNKTEKDSEDKKSANASEEKKAASEKDKDVDNANSNNLNAKYIREQLGVPTYEQVSIVYGEPFYNESSDSNLIWVAIAGVDENGEENGYYAAATFDADSGEIFGSIEPWGKIDDTYYADDSSKSFYYVEETALVEYGFNKLEVCLTSAIKTYDTHGNPAVKINYTVTNVGDTTPTISNQQFQMYADNYSVESTYTSPEEFMTYVNLSPGRSCNGVICGKVNADSVSSIEVDYQGVVFKIQ